MTLLGSKRLLVKLGLGEELDAHVAPPKEAPIQRKVRAHRRGLFRKLDKDANGLLGRVRRLRWRQLVDRYLGHTPMAHAGRGSVSMTNARVERGAADARAWSMSECVRIKRARARGAAGASTAHLDHISKFGDLITDLPREILIHLPLRERLESARR